MTKTTKANLLLGLVMLMTAAAVFYFLFNLFTLIRNIESLAEQVLEAQRTMKQDVEVCQAKGGEIVMLGNHKYACAKLEFLN